MISSGMVVPCLFGESCITKTMWTFNYFAFVLFVTCLKYVYSTGCESQIWCNGEILHAIQTAGIFEDSKTFVDMNLKTDPETVLKAFRLLSKADTLNATVLKKYLEENFDGPDLELEQWDPPDYKESPDFLGRIRDGTFRQFGKDLCRIWSHLGKKLKNTVKIHPERYSVIYLENPFIVPGGRFREIYYWDTYWVIKGLLVCEMKNTAKGILENLISLVKRLGFVPNGARIYYTNRSQPPLLIPMVHLYVQKTGDTQFLHHNMQHLVMEYEFWRNNRSVIVFGRNYTLYRYKVETNKPRPESYKADFETNNMKNSLNVTNDSLYSDLASAAESGWDFSSRWYSEAYNSNPNQSNWLTFTKTTDVLPIDLNSIQCWNEKILSYFYDVLGNTYAAQHYEELHNQTVSKIKETFWNDEDGSWYDVTISTGEHREQFYPSNLAPLFVGCIDQASKINYDSQILKYLKRSKVLKYLSGVPTSVVNTNQQWDYPNAWPPLQDIVITALQYSEVEESRNLALRLASDWIRSNLAGYQRTGAMFEKYVVTAVGSRGSGGEYNVQEGFGWTNGVILDLLDRYGQNLTYTQTNGSLASKIQPIIALLYVCTLSCIIRVLKL